MKRNDDFDVDVRYPEEPARRRFLRKMATTTVAPLALGNSSVAQAASSLAFSPAAFDATQNSVLIWVAGKDSMKVRVEVAEGASPDRFSAGPTVELAKAADYCATIPLTDLAPGKSWIYRIVDAESGITLGEPGIFKTAPATPAPYTFAFSADMEESYRPFKLFDVIAARRPDFFMHLGDTIYADHPKKGFNPSLSLYRAKHAANRKDPHLQNFMSRHVTYAVWDDHEVENNCHSGHPHMEAGLQAYREYWPCRAVDRNALYRQFTWSGVDYFILDTRRFRSLQTADDGPEKTMLGSAQKSWFKEGIKASRAPFKFVITSIPFHGAGPDSWGQYLQERNELVAFIKAEKISGVIFLTGDYHVARDWTSAKTGLAEFMAGPIATFTYYQVSPAARERYEKAGSFHYGDGFNFGLWSVDPMAGKARIEFVGAGGETLFSKELSA